MGMGMDPSMAGGPGGSPGMSPGGGPPGGGGAPQGPDPMTMALMAAATKGKKKGGAHGRPTKSRHKGRKTRSRKRG